jgi:hypothetical protein
MSKTRCKLSDEKYLKKLPEEPKYKCKKCGRLSKKEEQICKPTKF